MKMSVETPMTLGDFYVTKEVGIMFEQNNKMIWVPANCIMIPDNCYGCWRTEELVEKLKEFISEFNKSEYESLKKHCQNNDAEISSR